MKIKVEKPSEQEIQKRGIRSWPIWEKEASRFDWEYDAVEECYLLAGQVSVEYEEESVSFGAGDFVTFPQGLKCVWDIKEAVKKHYRFS